MTGPSDARAAFDHLLSWRCCLEDPMVELDLSCSGLRPEVLQGLVPRMQQALKAMEKLEAGSLANGDDAT